MLGGTTKAFARNVLLAGKWPAWTLRLAVVVAVASCVNDKIVYRNVQFPQPAAAAKNFVGYAQTDTKQTTCGNCHIDQQTKWSGTKHAKAWADLSSNISRISNSSSAKLVVNPCKSQPPLGRFSISPKR